MRIHKDHFGYESDLDDPDTYSYLPNTIEKVRDQMYNEMGFSLLYMDFFHPGEFSKSDPQRKRIKKLIKSYIADKFNTSLLWHQEQLFLFQDETENMC